VSEDPRTSVEVAAGWGCVDDGLRRLLGQGTRGAGARTAKSRTGAPDTRRRGRGRRDREPRCCSGCIVVACQRFMQRMHAAGVVRTGAAPRSPVLTRVRHARTQLPPPAGPWRSGGGRAVRGCRRAGQLQMSLPTTTGSRCAGPRTTRTTPAGSRACHAARSRAVAVLCCAALARRVRATCGLVGMPAHLTLAPPRARDGSAFGMMLSRATTTTTPARAKPAGS